MIHHGYVYNAIKVIKFEQYYRIFFQDDTSIVIQEDNLQLVENDNVQALSMDKFEYYKEISNIVSVKTEEGNSILTNEYKKVNFISKNTALYKYLNPKFSNHKIGFNFNNTIFPFGANKSQFKAVKYAMASQISIIEGPPGTGKTQTILNIIANIIKNGQTVAIVSNNNAATENVYEKLQKYHLDYLCAKLGKRENKEEFIKNQTGQYPKFPEELANEELIQNQIITLNRDMNSIFEIQNNIAKMKEQLGEIKIQHEYFNKQQGKDEIIVPKIRDINKITSDNIMKLKVEVEEISKVNLWFKIKSQFLYGIGNRKFYKRTKQDVIQSYNKLFLMIKEMELEQAIKSNERRLKSLGNNKLDLLTENSMKLLNEHLRKNMVRKQRGKYIKSQIYTIVR